MIRRKSVYNFAEEPPEVITIKCPICLQIMSKDISQTSCGHHFCTLCIERIHGPCPKCKATSYRIFPDTDRERIIGGLQVYCNHRDDGCTWKGELKNLSGHINKDEREGDCQFEVVHCRYWRCNVNMKRADLANHEEKECPYRPYNCQYCGDKNAYFRITEIHYNRCQRYPVTCPNRCDPNKTMPREDVDDHIKNDCPLEPVECELCWAGCIARPQRKDIEQHISSNQIQHLTLLAKACEELSIRCEELSIICEELKKENAELKKSNAKNQRK